MDALFDAIAKLLFWDPLDWTRRHRRLSDFTAMETIAILLGFWFVDSVLAASFAWWPAGIFPIFGRAEG